MKVGDKLTLIKRFTAYDTTYVEPDEKFEIISVNYKIQVKRLLNDETYFIAREVFHKFFLCQTHIEISL